MNKIIFHSNRMYNFEAREFAPVPAIQKIPKWFSSADKYETNEMGQTLLKWDGGRIGSFKSCPALLDIFNLGYLLVTPCDLKFYIKDNSPYVEVPKRFKDFCQERPPMKSFPSPHENYDKHFHWFPGWATELPDGYSAIYTHPINRFDLPFTTVSGIIDNDKMNFSGFMPFFLQKKFEGTIPAGTPYAQVIPFKREDWEMDARKHTYEEMYERHIMAGNLLRTKDGGEYKKSMWSKKKYT
jgi:hypothetical protein